MKQNEYIMYDAHYNEFIVDMGTAIDIAKRQGLNDRTIRRAAQFNTLIYNKYLVYKI